MSEVTAESGAVVKMAIYPLQRAVAKDLADALTKMLQTDADAAKAMKEQIRAAASAGQITRRQRESPSATWIWTSRSSCSRRRVPTRSLWPTVEKNLGPMGEIIHLLDSVPLADEMLGRIFPLEHADVDMLLTSLKDIFDQGKRLPEQPGRTVSGRIPSGLTGEALAYNVGLSGDKRTNTLIVSGRAEQLLLVQQIVKTVDVPQTAGGYSPRLVKLEHADVKAISDVVQKIAEQQQKIAEKVLSPAAAERQRTLIIRMCAPTADRVAREENFKEIEAWPASWTLSRTTGSVRSASSTCTT
jgi:type II secretory pathway component GspD/PulD (secretin)